MGGKRSVITDTGSTGESLILASVTFLKNALTGVGVVAQW